MYFIYKMHFIYPYPDQMVTAATRIHFVFRSDVASAPRDDLYSPERQRSPGHLDEPQRQSPRDRSPVKTLSPQEPDESFAKSDSALA